jgi:hypothetical protein
VYGWRVLFELNEEVSMRTIELDDRLFAEAQKVALESGRTVVAVVEDAVRKSLAEQTPKPVGRKYCFTTDGGRGVRPGVNLDSNAVLLDLMEKGDVPH